MNNPYVESNSPHTQLEPESSPPASQATRRSFWASLRFAFKAVEIRLRFIAVLVAIGLVIGYWETIKNYWDKWTRPSAGAVATIDERQEFYCPMHPSVVRSTLEPDGSMPKCPICNMPLSKRTKGAPPKLPPGVISRVQLSPHRVHLAGIQTAEIAERPLAREIRTVGYVSYDESRLSRIVTRVSGYVEKLSVNQTFVQVQQGDPLGEVYSPQLYTTVQELLIALKSNSKDLVEMTRDKLRLLGIDQREIDDIESARQANYRLVLRAPRSGHVVRKDVVEGDRVEAGQVLFQIADLSKVWVEAEIFEKDIAYLAVGQPIAATVEAFPTNLFAGKVALVYPELRSATRTNRVRFEMDNPELLLRPGMYATVRIEMRVQEIEPFKTQLAARKAEPDPNDEQAFIAYQKTCPVTGAKLGSMGKPVRATIDDHTLYLCCASCEDQLAEQPERFLARTSTVSESGVLAVPEQAVIDTGDQQIVYVEREPGVFEGVEVKLGPRAGGYYPVVEGLLPGDRVAAAGAFLIDAETRLNPAASSAYFGASGSRQSSAEPSISNSKNSNAGNRDAH